MTDDKLMREAYDKWWLDLTRKGDPVMRPNLVRDAWNAAVRATAMECARICERLAHELKLGSSASCMLAAKNIRSRFGLDTAAKEGM